MARYLYVQIKLLHSELSTISRDNRKDTIVGIVVKLLYYYNSSVVSPVECTERFDSIVNNNIVINETIINGTLYISIH